MLNDRIAALAVVTFCLWFALTGAAMAAFVDIDSNPHAEAIERMADLGILEGYGGGIFGPEDLLNRAQAAKVAASLLGFTQVDADEARGRPPMFEDVYVGMGGPNDWAVGWVSLIAEEGIILGYGDGNYGPADTLEMAQWAAILIRILGYEEDNMAWPTDYDETAEVLGLAQQLEYESKAYVNRAQMARFTDTAIHEVEKPDGSTIRDLLQDRDEAPDTEPVDPPTEIVVSIEVSPEFIGGGGGQVVSIMVRVTDADEHPIPGAIVSFDAEAFEAGSRRGQLSNRHATTDSAGRASIEYVTRSEDDERQIDINMAVEFDHIMEHRHVEILAADTATRVTGAIYDPYTGDPVPGASVLFFSADLNRTVAVTMTDDEGRYTSITSTGEFHVNIDFPDGSRHWLQEVIGEAGTTHVIDYDKGIVEGVALNWTAGDEIIALPLFPGGVSDHTCITTPDADGFFRLYLKPGDWDLAILGRPEFPGHRITVIGGQVNDVGAVNLRH